MEPILILFAVLLLICFLAPLIGADSRPLDPGRWTWW
jgi:hypothetical protein